MLAQEARWPSGVSAQGHWTAAQAADHSAWKGRCLCPPRVPLLREGVRCDPSASTWTARQAEGITRHGLCPPPEGRVGDGAVARETGSSCPCNLGQALVVCILQMRERDRGKHRAGGWLLRPL